MRHWGTRVLTAVVAVALSLAVAPSAHASTMAKHYVAGGGGPTAKGTPLASCSNSEWPANVGGACFTVTGPAVFQAHARDVSSNSVSLYVEVDDQFIGFFCNTTSDIVVPSSGTHQLGIWVGGADAAAGGCGIGQATTGWIFLNQVG